MDIIMYINMAIMSLTQLGVGPEAGFIITSDAEIWSDFIGDKIDIEGVRTFIYLKVRLVFDPPSNAYLVEVIERQIHELEWRLNVQADVPVITTQTTVEGGTTVV